MHFTRNSKPSRASHEDQQGFLRDDRQLIKDASEAKKLEFVVIPLPQAKELINCGRPTELQPRCLSVDSICELDFPLLTSKEQTKQNCVELPIDSQQTSTKLPKNNDDAFAQQSSAINAATIKRTYNGKNKTLYDFFQLDDSFRCVYRKSKEATTKQEAIYDYTAKQRMLQLVNDYDPKLYMTLKPYAQNTMSQNDLTFDSNFESGNLSHAYQQKSRQFYCLLENDTNTHGYTNWFFFSVRNRRCGTYTFHIMNMSKKTSMFRQGMKISIFSDSQYRKDKKCWYKGGEDITYVNTKIERTNKENQNYYCLAFNYTFQEAQDTVYFALNQPYPYSRLVKFLNEIEPKYQTNGINYTKKTIGYTLSNNIMTSLVISDDVKNKKVILIMARQHPGETVGSFVAEGILETLSQKQPEYEYLLKKFKFIVIPMVNPDGVIYGNSRCNLSGLDLNRQWGPELVKQLTPETFIIRKYIQNLHEEFGVQMMIDLHGHSKKMNSFFYACKKDNRCAMRLFSFIMNKFTDCFDVYSCTYGLTKDKANTVRSQLYNMGIPSYTLENSYYGKDKSGQKEHFSERDLKGLGVSVLKSLYVLYASKETLKNYPVNKQSVMQELEQNIDKIQNQQSKEKDDSGSESDPDGDILALEQRVKTLKIRDTTKKSKLIKSFGNSLKRKRFLSSIFQNKMEKEAEEEEKEKERRKKAKTEKSVESKMVSMPTEPEKITFQKKPTKNQGAPKKFQRPSRTQTQSFKFSSNRQIKQPSESAILTRHKQLTQKESTSSTKETKPLYGRLLFEHPGRRKASLRQPLKLTKTEQHISRETLQRNAHAKQSPLKKHSSRFITELQAIKLRLTRQQLLKSCDIQGKQKSLDQTQFMKIQSLYRSKRQRDVNNNPSPVTLSRKVSRSKKKFKVTTVDASYTSKYKKFQMFVSETTTSAAGKLRGFSGIGDYNNSVFYQFPLL